MWGSDLMTSKAKFDSWFSSLAAVASPSVTARLSAHLIHTLASSTAEHSGEAQATQLWRGSSGASGVDQLKRSAVEGVRRV